MVTESMRGHSDNHTHDTKTQLDWAVLRPNEQWSYTYGIDDYGPNPYYDRLHLWMNGTVMVTP